MVLIPFREVPSRFFSQAQSLLGKIEGCEILVEVFVDTNNKVVFDCDHNTAQLKRVINYLLS